MNTSLSTVFQGTLNLICNCGEDIETTFHCLLHCPDYLHERKTLLNKVSCIVLNIFDFNNDQVIEIILYGKEHLDVNDTSILDATIYYLIETKRFNVEIFWCSPDVMTLTLMLHLKFEFLLIFSLFCFYYFYLSIIFRLFLYFICISFCSQVYHNIYVYLVIVNFFV